MNENRIVVGIDVGGTNTDAVLIQNDKIISQHKTKTSDDITHGIYIAVSELFKFHENLKQKVDSINIGTTHLLNALLQRQNLDKPLVVRLAAPLTDALPPTIDWKEDLKPLIHKCCIVSGGYEYNETEIAPLDIAELEKVAKNAVVENVTSVAITSVFSPIKPDHEIIAGEIFRQPNLKIGISLSHQLGELGLLGRENATIVNALLFSQYQRITDAIKKAFASLALSARVYLTQGNGIKERIEALSTSPILTLNSGPINSVKGAAWLAGVDSAVTIDIGGTSTDLGIIKNGMPVNENLKSQIAGIDCSFTSPRFNSIPLGGGTIITKNELTGSFKLGPQSVGSALFEKALAFGGNILTPTDVAIALGRIKIEGADYERLKAAILHLYPTEEFSAFINKIDNLIYKELIEGILKTLDSMEKSKIPSNLVLVGGGAVLFDLSRLKQDLVVKKKIFEKIIISDNANVANAYGAALSKIGGVFKRVYCLKATPFEIARKDAIEQAKINAISKGADNDTIEVMYENQIPLSYLPDDPIQLSILVAGREVQNTTQISSSECKKQETDPFNDYVEFSDKIGTTLVEELKGERKNLQTDTLTIEMINDIATGSALMGSGGGGNPEFERLMTIGAIQGGKQVRLVSLENLPDDATTILCGAGGSPNIFSERLFTKHEGINVIRILEKQIGKKIDALVIAEVGGGNGIYPLFLGAMLDIPVINADCMGRAFPQLQMITPYIYGSLDDPKAIENPTAVLSNGKEHKVVSAETFPLLEEAFRSSLLNLGCSVTLALLPLTGKQVKNWTIKNTLSIAQKIGKAVNSTKEQSFSKRLEQLNNVLNETDYKKAEMLCEGKIIGIRRTEGGFSTGGFLIKNKDDVFEVGFQNENLAVWKRPFDKMIANVPDLITIVDTNTFRVIFCEDLKYGQDVAVLTMKAPEMLKTKIAKAVVGKNAPAFAAPMEEIKKLLKTMNI